jgi:hypothetical protein
MVSARFAARSAFALLTASAFFCTGRLPAYASRCTASAPGIQIDNTWGWSAWGSFGLPGQQLKYALDVRNYDLGCGSSTFVVSLSAPSGFAVSMPSNSITLNSYSSGYVWAYVTSPSGIANGDYALSATVERAGTSTPSAPFTSYYKVYSSDTVAPSLFWPNPADGTTISGRSYNVVVSSTDDHAVKHIDLYIDDVFRSTTACDDIAYTCQLSYTWSLHGVTGRHAVTFKSYDWMGNVGTLTVTFTVS